MLDDHPRCTDLDEMSDYITVTQAAEVLGIARTGVWRYVNQGALRAKNFVGILVIHRDDLERFRARPRRTGRPSVRPPMPMDKPVSTKLRFEILERDGYACQYCGRRAPEVTLRADHIVPRSKGGRTTPDNLMACCHDCNVGKADRIVVPPSWGKSDCPSLGGAGGPSRAEATRATGVQVANTRQSGNVKVHRER